jgi:LEA14-like dessication related protein
MRVLSRILLVWLALVLGACAGLPGRDPPRVTVAGIEALEGEGLELRMLVKLRVVNPNDFPIAYDGVYVRLDLQDHTVATGVSDERGEIPRFGEAVVPVRVTISLVDVARRALRMFKQGEPPETLHYRLEGKLNGPMFGAIRFQTEGELKLPAGS